VYNNFYVVDGRLLLFREEVVGMTTAEKIALAISAAQLLLTIYDVFFK